MKGIQNLLYVPDKEEVDDGFGKPPAYHTAEWMPGQHDSNEERWRSDMFPLWIFSPEETGRERLSEGAIETASLTGMEALPIQNAVYPIKEEVQVDHDADLENGTAPGWTNGDTSQTDSQQEAGASPDGDFSVDGLEAPSAGETAKGALGSVFANDNRANPGFAPMQVALLGAKELPIRGDRREVSIEMTNGINSRLTRLNRGWPIGINFTVLSRLEGGSNPRANLPIAKKELDLERKLIAEDKKNGTNKAAKMKWANMSGVTIGSGFDLGQTSIDEMRGMGFPESLIGKCAPYVGKKRVAADDELGKKPLILSNEEIDFVNDTVMMDKAQKSISDWDSRIARLRKTMPNAPFFHEMTSAQQTIVFSRYYHQGSGWIDKTDNKPMFEAMKRNDWATVNRQLEGLVNRYKKSGPEWMWTRFSQELKFLKKGS